MTPGEAADFLTNYGWMGIAVLEGLAIVWLVWEWRSAYRREVATAESHTEKLVAANDKVHVTATSVQRSVDALTASIEHRNPLTAVLGESQKATVEALGRLAESVDRLWRAIEEDRRDGIKIADRLEQATRNSEEARRRIEQSLAAIQSRVST
jgi:hypothetical protein